MRGVDFARWIHAGMPSSCSLTRSRRSMALLITEYTYTPLMRTPSPHSSQWLQQGSWPCTMCVIRTITHISTEHVDTCPNSPSSGIDLTPRTLNSRTLTFLRSDPYAKLVYTGCWGRPRRINIGYTDPCLLYQVNTSTLMHSPANTYPSEATSTAISCATKRHRWSTVTSPRIEQLARLLDPSLTPGSLIQHIWSVQAGRHELKVHSHGSWEISIWHCSLLRLRDGIQDRAHTSAWQACRRYCWTHGWRCNSKDKHSSSTELLRPSGAGPCSRPLKTWTSVIVLWLILSLRHWPSHRHQVPPQLLCRVLLVHTA